MSLKNSITTASYMDFDSTLNKSMKLLKDKKNFKIAFLTILGINVGLRISDLLELKHEDMIGESFQVIEKKTSKPRTIKINDTIKAAYISYIEMLGKVNNNGYLFISQKKERFSIRQVNRLLQQLYGAKNKNISSHSLRKTFGRRVWNNDNQSERALIMLSKLFNHTSSATTRLYLGIEQEELNDIYMTL